MTELPAWIHALPFRLGTTSYIIPDEILPNVRYLAKQVRDIELLLFELEDGLNNMPDKDCINELRHIATDQGLSYTIHLPLDLDLGATGDNRKTTLRKAQRAIESVRLLDPEAYVLPLDGDGLLQDAGVAGVVHLLDPPPAWCERAVQVLEILGNWTGGTDLLAIENLDGYPPDFNSPIIHMTSASRCVDIGHLWKDDEDPISYLNICLPRTRVIHMHGIGECDHQSLAHVPTEKIDEILSLLMRAPYTGNVTLEVFSESDLASSLQIIHSSLSRVESM